MSVSTFPTLFMMKDNRIAVTIPEHDTANAQNSVVHRIDLSFGGPKALSPVPSLYDVDPHIYNFFEQYTPQGVTGVRGGERVIYENIYPKIDLHVTSNKWGPKLFVVIRPGGNPADIELLCQGQDSLKVDVDGYLKLYFDNKFITLTQGLAYQQQGENIQLLPWIATYTPESDGLHVNVNFSDYNPELPLIFMIRPFNPDELPAGGGGSCGTPEWSTYLGGGGDDAVNDLAHDDDGYLYFTGRSSSGSGIPVNNGASQATPPGGGDMILGRANSFYEIQTQDESTWTTFFGGNGQDQGKGLVYDPVNDRLVVVGQMLSSITSKPNLPYPGNTLCYNRTESVPSAAFVAFFNKVTGYPIFLSRIPGTSLGLKQDVDVDAQGNTYVVSGGTVFLTSAEYSAPFVPGAYWQNQTGGSQTFAHDGMVLRLDPQASLTWWTVLGGPVDEVLETCVVDRTSGILYVGGWTNTPNNTNTPDACVPSEANTQLPLCGNGAQFFQKGLNSINSQNYPTNPDGWLAAFKLSDLTLAWSTYFGGQGEDYILDLAVSGSGELYAVGLSSSAVYSTSSCISDVTAPGFPNCDAGGFFNGSVGGRKHFIAKFNYSAALTWCTRLGDAHPISFEDSQIRVTLDDQDNVVVLGTTVYTNTSFLEPAPTTELENAFNCPDHGDEGMGPRADCFVAQFDAATNLNYCTFFGGQGNEFAGAVAAFDGRIYIGGEVYAGLNFPTHAPVIAGREPYLDDVPNAQLTVPDGFLAQLRYDITIGLDETGATTTGELVVYPNPTNGQVTIVLPERIASGRIDLFDSVGRLVLSQALQSVNTVAVDLTPFAKGSYTALVHLGQRTMAAQVLRTW